MSEPRKAWPAGVKAAAESGAEPAEPRGLRCPKCGCGHFPAFCMRSAWGGRIVRRRECRHCGRRVVTTERVSG